MQTFWEGFFQWLSVNIVPIIVVTSIAVIGLIIYIIVKRQIRKQLKQEKMDEGHAKSLLKLTKVIIVVIIIGAILTSFVETIGTFILVVILLFGVIVGVAARDTIGNMIAGFILWTNKPFEIGDYLIYDDLILKVRNIRTIFTETISFEGIKISFPNQKLMGDEIRNIKRKSPLRRKIPVTIPYEEDQEKVKNALLEAVTSMNQVLEFPKPFVRITQFHNKSVEYSVYIFIKDIKSVWITEGEARSNILATAKKYNIDLSTEGFDNLTIQDPTKY